jgi:hypothetical protein
VNVDGCLKFLAYSSATNRHAPASPFAPATAVYYLQFIHFVLAMGLATGGLSHGQSLCFSVQQHT